MKAVTFLLCFMSVASVGFGQLSETYKNKVLIPTVKKPGFKLTPPDDNQFTLPQKSKNNDMPVVGLISKGTFKGNNGKGSDIYIYEPDNMPCLKPDSTFRSNMPKGKQSITKN